MKKVKNNYFNSQEAMKYLKELNGCVSQVDTHIRYFYHDNKFICINMAVELLVWRGDGLRVFSGTIVDTIPQGEYNSVSFHGIVHAGNGIVLNLHKTINVKSMQRKRVKKGEYYLIIRIHGGYFKIDSAKDNRQSFDLENFKSGNYFTTIEEAQKVLEKVSACFDGKVEIFDIDFHKHLFNKYLEEKK